MQNFKCITSKENSLIKLVSSLQTSAKTRKKEGFFVLEGLRICEDICENGIRFDKLIISETAFSKYQETVEKFANNANECYKITDNLFKKISDTTSPQGIIAVCKMPDNIKGIDKKGKYIALENINDPSNLGAVSRTAEALGVTGIILTENGCDPYSPKSIRASMGTLIRMPIYLTDDIAAFCNENKLLSYACVVDRTAEKITNISFSGGSVVIIGNEANGITEETKKAAFKCVTIPMRGKAESLNAAVAASISIWEMMK